MDERALARAAAAIRDCDALLICTGAGMGVDSGLGTFRGRNAGVWAPLKAMQMDFSEMSCPDWFESDARLAWAFWHFRHQAYTKGKPHAGYDLLAKWGARSPHSVFSVTSNIDGHWPRTRGIGEEKTFECHGALTHLQRVDEDSGRVWPTEDAEIAAMDVPAYDLSPGECVEAIVGGASAAAEWTRCVVASDGCGVVAADDGRPLRVSAVRRPGGPDLFRVAATSPLPRCAMSGAPARPCVLMFGDGGVNCERIDAQHERYRRWLDALPERAKLAVVEVGAGLAVPTVRRIAENATHRFARATLVRVNLDDSEVPRSLGERGVSVGGLGALDALSRIDALMSEEAGHSGS